MKIQNNKIRRIFFGIAFLAMFSIMTVSKIKRAADHDSNTFQIRVKISKIDISIGY